ncbi:MAG: glycosyltransferase family 2 protein [Pleurocapsa minor GSE-CHR-MK-17-07R]|nr:glycosyltransferase family 2 protein [Pleurocapsa minor GSE-CHR-MK 17-07R]
MISLSVIVPVYRSQESLPELTAALASTLPELADQFEVIFVNDCSPDDSWRVIESLTNQYAWVSGINLMRNYGQHNALLCGIRAAQYELIATIDDDLQHPPSVLKGMIAHLIEQNMDVVYGAPEREQHGLLRDLASQITKWVLQSSMGVKSARKVSALRVFRTQLRDAFGTYRSPFVSIDVLLTWGTTRFSFVEVPHVPRKYGASNYTLRKLITHALNMITGFSIVPLQIASILGFVLALFGLLILLYVVGRYFIDGGVVPGFPFLASIIAIFSGAQLFALGIIGEYIARIYFRTMDRPPYTVRGRTQQDQQDHS